MPLGTEEGLGPGDIVLDGEPNLPVKKGHIPPTLRSVSIVAKGSLVLATAEHLYIRTKFQTLICLTVVVNASYMIHVLWCVGASSSASCTRWSSRPSSTAATAARLSN